MQLMDLGFNGYIFTWSNKQAGVHNIHERLDRGVANLSWMNRFSEARMNYLARGYVVS